MKYKCIFCEEMVECENVPLVVLCKKHTNSIVNSDIPNPMDFLWK